MLVVKAWLEYLSGRGARTERGASLVEYALLVALIAMVCLAAVQFFGGSTSSSISTSASRVVAAG